VAGTIEFRFSSSEDAFGSGTNLQNLTLGKKSDETGLQLPNMRCLIAADAGKTIVDVDLERADLWIVVWEAGDDEFKYVLRSGLDVHLYTARGIYAALKAEYTLDDLKDHEKVAFLKKKFYWKRQASKEFVHATNYYGQANTVSHLINETVHETGRLQKRYLGEHPGIPDWWDRIRLQLMTTRTITNIFGNRIFFFDRVEDCFTDALAWQPASTVALITNRGMVNVDRHCPDTEIMLQNHDSLSLQVPTNRTPQIYSEIRPHLQITLPYPDPFFIPIGFATSTKSWGDIEHVEV
jgi:DNA polymerase I-like protein with 3'-5' exonuclease and polymerase domains